MAAACALLAVLAPAASASTQSAGGLKYVTESTRAKDLGVVTATAACPKGTRAIGGGERNGAGFGVFALEQTFPYDGGDRGSKPDDGWRVRVRHFSSFAHRLKVTAICGDAKVSYREERFDVGGGTQTGEESVGCPSDTFALSGGVEAAKKSLMYLNSAYPAEPSDTGATAWGMYVDNPGSATKATAHVVCGKSKPTILTTAVSNIPNSTRGGGTVNCPAGRFPYGGGQGNNAGYQGLRTETLAPSGSDGWVAEIDKFGAYTLDMTVYALCGKPLN